MFILTKGGINKRLRKVMHIVCQQGTMTTVLLDAPQSAKKILQQAKGGFLKIESDRKCYTHTHIK